MQQYGSNLAHQILGDTNMVNILIVMGRYLPGYKDGGPVRSTKNLVDQFGKEYNIRVTAYDRDVGDTEQYPGIKLYSWNKVGNGLVYYVPENKFTYKVLMELSKQVDIVYLWGCFNKYTIKVLILKRLGLISNRVVVAGMGLFSPMAFQIKYLKKKTVVTLMNMAGLFKNIYWSATSDMEVNEIKKQVWARDEQFFIAEDLPRAVDENFIPKQKGKGELKVVWISRITPKKNLIAAIKILQQVNKNIIFTIYGPVFDQEYWNECKVELDKLPENIRWIYKGNIDSENVVEKLKRHHIFLFPTLGENYGHVIQEALSAGCPCILSDQTPWDDLEDSSAGYVYTLNHEIDFINAIDKYAGMDQKEFQNASDAALNFVVQRGKDSLKNSGYKNIFEL